MSGEMGCATRDSAQSTEPSTPTPLLVDDGWAGNSYSAGVDDFHGYFAHIARTCSLYEIIESIVLVHSAQVFAELAQSLLFGQVVQANPAAHEQPGAVPPSRSSCTPVEHEYQLVSQIRLRAMLQFAGVKPHQSLAASKTVVSLVTEKYYAEENRRQGICPTPAGQWLLQNSPAPPPSDPRHGTGPTTLVVKMPADMTFHESVGAHALQLVPLEELCACACMRRRLTASLTSRLESRSPWAPSPTAVSSHRRRHRQPASPDRPDPPPSPPFDSSRYMVLTTKMGYSKVVGDFMRASLRGECLTLHPLRRWLAINRVFERKAPIFVLCGGTSGCGKSTLANLVAARLGIETVISTDTIRQVLRSHLDRTAYPECFASSYEAHKVRAERPHPTIGEDELMTLNGHRVTARGRAILRAFKRQCQCIFPVLDDMLRGFRERGESCVVEGVHLLTEYMIYTMQNMMDVHHVLCIPILVHIVNEVKHFERLSVRAKAMSLLPQNNKYAANFDAIRTIQNYLVSLARGTDVLLVNNTNVDRSMMLIHRYILECLDEDYSFGDRGEELDPPAALVAKSVASPHTPGPSHHAGRGSAGSSAAGDDPASTGPAPSAPVAEDVEGAASAPREATLLSGKKLLHMLLLRRREKQSHTSTRTLLPSGNPAAAPALPVERSGSVPRPASPGQPATGPTADMGAGEAGAGVPDQEAVAAPLLLLPPLPTGSTPPGRWLGLRRGGALDPPATGTNPSHGRAAGEPSLAPRAAGRRGTMHDLHIAPRPTGRSSASRPRSRSAELLTNHLFGVFSEQSRLEQLTVASPLDPPLAHWAVGTDAAPESPRRHPEGGGEAAGGEPTPGATPDAPPPTAIECPGWRSDAVAGDATPPPVPPAAEPPSPPREDQRRPAGARGIHPVGDGATAFRPAPTAKAGPPNRAPSHGASGADPLLQFYEKSRKKYQLHRRHLFHLGQTRSSSADDVDRQPTVPLGGPVRRAAAFNMCRQVQHRPTAVPSVERMLRTHQAVSRHHHHHHGHHLYPRHVAPLDLHTDHSESPRPETDTSDNDNNKSVCLDHHEESYSFTAS